MEGQKLIALDTYNGFIVLLLVPLLYWYRRRKSATRDVELSLFPLLDTMGKEKKIPFTRKFKIPQGVRTLLLIGCLFFLALSYNGIHLEKPTREPGEWLLIFDNNPSGRAEYNGITVLEELKSRVRVFLRRTDDADTYTLFVTSPEPELVEKLRKDELLVRLDAIKNAERAKEIMDLTQIANILSREVAYKKIAIISSRSQSWRDTLHDHSLTSSIPPDGEILTGNAGITVLDVTTAGPGRFNLYLQTASKGLDGGDLKVDISSDNQPPQTVSLPVKADGSGELFLPDITLEPGATHLALQIDDVFAPDNFGKIRNISDIQSEISVWSRGNTRPFIDAFINSYPQFKANQPGLALNVVIFDSIPPTSDTDYPALVIFPAQPFEDFELKRVWATPLTARFHPGHSAVGNAASFRHFRLGKILEYSIPKQFQVLAEAEGIPLIVAGVQNDRPLVIWFFDPADNGIYLDPAFPVLLHDTLLWLTQSERIQTDSDLCQTSLMSSWQGDSSPENDSFFECVAMIHEAARISLPDLTWIVDMNPGPGSNKRKDLAKIFLLAALILLFILSLDRAGQNGWER
jgi:hypothetical protein